MTEPIVILDKDTAALTVEPLLQLVFDRLASHMGADAVRSLLPIQADVEITLRSGDLVITTIIMGSRCDALETAN